MQQHSTRPNSQLVPWVFFFPLYLIPLPSLGNVILCISFWKTDNIAPIFVGTEDSTGVAPGNFPSGQESWQAFRYQYRTVLSLRQRLIITCLVSLPLAQGYHFRNLAAVLRYCRKENIWKEKEVSMPPANQIVAFLAT